MRSLRNLAFVPVFLAVALNVHAQGGVDMRIPPVTMGLASMASNDYPKAIEYFDKAIADNPKNEEAYFHRGRAHKTLGDAKRSTARAQANPGNSDPRTAGRPERADARVAAAANADYQRALSDFDKAIDLNPKKVEAERDKEEVRKRWADALRYRGQIYIIQGNLDRALSDLNKSLEVSPRSYALLDRAEAYTLRKDAPRADADYRDAASSFPKYSIEYFTDKLKTDPSEARYLIYRARAHRFNNETSAALADLTKATEVDPRNAEA
jgi:tetratricopeptide (TPR) repeat protein